jgi:hypothetical protein
VAHYADDEDALTFRRVEVGEGIKLAGHQLSGPFLENQVCPLFLAWDSVKRGCRRSEGAHSGRGFRVSSRIQEVLRRVGNQRLTQAAGFQPLRRRGSGLGLFGFGKNKKEARITTEFFINAIHVMAGANALEDGDVSDPLPQARRAEQSQQFTQFHNYVALPRSEAFRIEYWALEEAKLQRMPAEAEFSRKIALVIGGASGIGREVALLLARKGAHVVVADLDQQGQGKLPIKSER